MDLHVCPQCGHHFYQEIDWREQPVSSWSFWYKPGDGMMINAEAWLYRDNLGPGKVYRAVCPPISTDVFGWGDSEDQAVTDLRTKLNKGSVG